MATLPFPCELGKRAPAKDPLHRTLQFGDYLDRATLPPAPTNIDWFSKCAPDAGVLLNDRLGDCTIAATGHAIQAWTANAQGREVTVPDAAILAAYEAACGYDPADPSTDQGGVMLDVCKYWRTTGVGGHRITAFARVKPKNPSMVRDALWLFGGVYTGLALPLTAQAQIGKVWDVGTRARGRPNSWGGHAVATIGFDATGLTCVTWGALQKMTWSFWARYADEAFAILSPDWLTQNKCPAGFDLPQLQVDLKAVTK